jgi:hypothetical protein
MKNVKTGLLLLVIIVLIGLAYTVYSPTEDVQSNPEESVDISDEAVMCTAGAMECPDGTFVGRTGPNCEFVCPEVEDLEVTEELDIEIDGLTAGDVISSPLALSGEARGTWYFEASAPVEILDWQGMVIAQSFVTAQGDWMTTDFVPFIGTINFTSPYSPGDPVAWKQGSIVFKKDNPSGEPQNDAQVIVPIQFAP